MGPLTSALRDRWVRTRALYSVSFCHRRADGSTRRVAECGKRKSHVKSGAMSHVAPAFAQKAEIEAVNAKWIDFFNKGEFAGVASTPKTPAHFHRVPERMSYPIARHCGQPRSDPQADATR